MFPMELMTFFLLFNLKHCSYFVTFLSSRKSRQVSKTYYDRRLRSKVIDGLDKI